MPDLDDEVADMSRRLDTLEYDLRELRNAVWELQRQVRTPTFPRGLTPVERDK